MACLQALDAVILCGGQGTRLRPAVADRPKVLAPVAGRPFLEHLLEPIAAAGIRRVVLALGHQASHVRDYLAARRPDGLTFVASVEDQPLGTGGALRLAAQHVEGSLALVWNGDSLTRTDVCALVAAHRASGASWTMLLTACEAADRYALVDTAPDGRVTAFHPRGGARAGDISAGVYVTSRPVIEAWIPAGRPVSLESDVLPQRCGPALRAVRGTFPFIDIGTPESFAQASAFIEQAAA